MIVESENSQRHLAVSMTERERSGLDMASRLDTARAVCKRGRPAGDGVG